MAQLKKCERCGSYYMANDDSSTVANVNTSDASSATDLISTYKLPPPKPPKPFYDKPRLDAHGQPVKNIVSLRPGAGINPGQSTYGFSSMLPSNRAGEAYTIDQWGKKRYL